MAKMRYLKNVTTLQFDVGKCTGCKRCIEVCPHGVFVIDNGRARIDDLDACMECGACALNCSAEAIKVESGVGCAAGIIIGAVRGTEPSCGCDEDSCCT
jgi:NAD-dependent dihydropyrimidine dehydrogenase PreA subunit